VHPAEALRTSRRRAGFGDGDASAAEALSKAPQPRTRHRRHLRHRHIHRRHLRHQHIHRRHLRHQHVTDDTSATSTSTMTPPPRHLSHGVVSCGCSDRHEDRVGAVQCEEARTDVPQLPQKAATGSSGISHRLQTPARRRTDARVACLGLQRASSRPLWRTCGHGRGVRRAAPARTGC